MPNLLFAPAHIPLVIAGLLASSSLMAAPVAPLPLFSENFDNTAAPNASGPLKPLLLDQYVSAATDFAGAALGETYGAVASEKYLTTDTRPYWINPGYCNGIWVSYDMANPNAGAAAGSPLICNARQLSPVNPAGLGNSIAAWQNLQVLANVLGQVTNPTPNTRPSDNTGNHIIAAYTEAYDNLAAREFTILKTNKNIPIPPGGRFLTFSVAAAAVNCSATTPPQTNSEPQYMFKLIKPDASELPMNTTALNPCRQGTRYAFDATKTNEPGYLPKNTFNGSPVFAAQLRGDRAYLITDAAVGMRFTNLNSRGSGNDGAFDNIVMLDVSPNLAKSFSPAAISVGQTSRLTFTVTNTTDLLEKVGWTFKDTLPAGMVVASPANISNQCGATTVTASSGTAVIDVTSGVLAAGASECTISVDVTAQAASPLPASGAILQNAFGSQAGPGIVTTTALVPTTGASLTVTPVADMVATPTAPIQWGLGVPGSITTVCSNNGPDIAAAATCEVSGAPAGAQTICTPASGSTDLQPNQSIACVTSFTMTTPGTVTLTTKAGSTSTDPNPGNNVQTVNVTAVPPAADMQAAAPTSVSAVTGQSTTVTTTCTNNGPDSAAMATCTVTGAPSGATTICTPASPMASLAVGASMSCATTFTPKTAGSVTLTTTAGTSTADSNSANNVASTTVTAGAAPTDAAAVPTLGEWALIALSTLLGGFAWVSLRRRRVP